MPRVSVVVICYNGERHIGGAIDSVLAQTVDDLELVVVDDGSTDGTAEIVADYAARDRRVRAVRQPNRGPNAARNNGIRHATARWVAFLDCDDRWSPEKLERQLARADRGDVGFVYSGSRLVSETGDLIAELLPEHEGDIVPALLIKNVVTGSASSAMVAREHLDAVGGFDETLTHSEDWDMWLRVASRCRVGTVQRPDVVIVMRAGSHGSNPEQIRDQGLRVLDRAFTTYARSHAGLRNAAMAELHFMASLNYNKARRGREERRELLRMLRYRPFQPFIYRRILRSLLP